MKVIRANTVVYLSDRCCSGCGLRVHKSLRGWHLLRTVWVGSEGDTVWIFSPLSPPKTLFYDCDYCYHIADTTWEEKWTFAVRMVISLDWDQNGAEWNSWETWWVGQWRRTDLFIYQLYPIPQLVWCFPSMACSGMQSGDYRGVRGQFYQYNIHYFT